MLSTRPPPSAAASPPRCTTAWCRTWPPPPSRWPPEPATSSTHGHTAAAARVEGAGEAVRTGIAGLRSLLVDIYPPNLHAAGLPAALHDLGTGVRADVAVEIDEAAAARLDDAGAEAVFRTAQEALRNAAAHAGADHVWLHLTGDVDDVVLEVGDDGCGLDPDLRPEGHFGLALLQDAARQASAELAVATAPGAGTRWRLTVPAAAASVERVPA